jgi:hypothetical protein
MKRLLLLLPALAGLFFAGCDLFAGDDYYPLTVGNVWNYTGALTQTSTLASTDTVMTWQWRLEVTGTDTLNSGIAVFEVETQTETHMSAPYDTTFSDTSVVYWQQTDTCVYSYTDKADTTGSVIVRLPLEVGKSWTTGSMTTTVAAQENVTVEAGTYKKAWRLDLTDSTSTTYSAHAWYGNGVGTVKQEQTSSYSGFTNHLVMELTSATIK